MRRRIAALHERDMAERDSSLPNSLFLIMDIPQRRARAITVQNKQKFISGFQARLAA
jgi:hypothetical protein